MVETPAEEHKGASNDDRNLLSCTRTWLGRTVTCGESYLKHRAEVLGRRDKRDGHKVQTEKSSKGS